MAVGWGVILSLQESLAGDFEAVWVDPAALRRAALGASSLPFRGSLRSCDKMGWMSSLLHKMGWMSSLLTGGRQLPTCLLLPRSANPSGRGLMLCWWHQVTVTPPPQDPLFSQPTSLLGNRNTPLKGL